MQLYRFAMLTEIVPVISIRNIIKRHVHSWKVMMHILWAALYIITRGGARISELERTPGRVAVDLPPLPLPLQPIQKSSYLCESHGLSCWRPGRSWPLDSLPATNPDHNMVQSSGIFLLLKQQNLHTYLFPYLL